MTPVDRPELRAIYTPAHTGELLNAHLRYPNNISIVSFREDVHGIRVREYPTFGKSDTPCKTMREATLSEVEIVMDALDKTLEDANSRPIKGRVVELIRQEAEYFATTERNRCLNKRSDVAKEYDKITREIDRYNKFLESLPPPIALEE